VTGPKTNEREGTRAVLRHTRTSAFKIRPVLDLVRDQPVRQARDILRFSERDAAQLVLKLVDSAVANAVENDGLVEEELFVSACFADEARTVKTFRPRARGRAGKVLKRSAHITVIVSRLPEERLARVKAKADAQLVERRRRRVAGSRGQRAEAPEEAEGTEQTGRRRRRERPDRPEGRNRRLRRHPDQSAADHDGDDHDGDETAAGTPSVDEPATPEDTEADAGAGGADDADDAGADAPQDATSDDDGETTPQSSSERSEGDEMGQGH
jgi:large subunit ribosomal protein L22